MAWGWPGAILPSGNQQKTVRDLEAGWTAGWAALGWRGLATGLGGYSRLAGFGWAS